MGCEGSAESEGLPHASEPTLIFMYSLFLSLKVLDSDLELPLTRGLLPDLHTILIPVVGLGEADKGSLALRNLDFIWLRLEPQLPLIKLGKLVLVWLSELIVEGLEDPLPVVEIGADARLEGSRG